LVEFCIIVFIKVKLKENNDRTTQNFVEIGNEEEGYLGNNSMKWAILFLVQRVDKSLMLDLIDMNYLNIKTIAI
jgi:hypothetical protein